MKRDPEANEAFLQLALATDKFERYANAHAQRISVIADEIARVFNMARQDRNSLKIAALVHDLGEAIMDRNYIQREGTLTEEEQIDLTRHPIIGEQEVARAGADRAAQLLVRWHHEWWNGSGYPDALRREEIPLGARILRAADSYAALTDVRPYRPARTRAKALEELVSWAGIEFDPRVVNVLVSLDSLPELESFAESNRSVNYESEQKLSPIVSFTG